jgi:zinc transport system permease protein
MDSLLFWAPTIVVSVLASILVAIVGVFAVARKTSYMAGSIAHSAFGGLGIAFALGLSPLLGASIFALLTAILVIWIKQRFKAYEDILLNGIWALGMAIGIFALHLTQGYVPDLFAYLFGNILLTDFYDAIYLGIALLVIAIFLYRFYDLIQTVSFDEDYAKVLNLPTLSVSLGIMIALAMVTVLLLKIMGMILVVCLIAIPAAAALHLTHLLPKALLLSILFSLTSVLGGTGLAIYWDLPPTPMIVFLSLIILGVAFLIKSRK